ncbi:MAG: sensor histidine kinase [Anaerolineae bacterium]
MSSLLWKIVFAFVIILLIPTIILSLVGTTVASGMLLDRFRQQQVALMATRAAKVEQDLLRIVNDLQIIRDDRSIREFLISTDGKISAVQLRNIEQFFSDYLKHSPNYKDLSIINPSGKEYVRVINTDGTSRVVIGSDLGSSGDGPYFQKTLELADGEIYSAGLELNNDQGKLTQPYLPIIRFSTPLYDSSSNLVAVLVLKALAAPALADASSVIDPDNPNFGDSLGDTYVVDEAGTYWSHPDASKLYSSVLKTDVNFQSDLPETAKEYSAATEDQGYFNTTSERPDTLQFYARVELEGQDSINWLVYHEVEQAPLLTQVSQMRYRIYLFGAIVMLLAAGLGFALARTIVSPVNALTEAATNLAQRRWDTPLPDMERTDEIGRLTRAIGSMSTELEKAYSELQVTVKDLKTARRLAEENSRLKSEFLSTMSHELRTPLNAIEGFTGIILNKLGGTEYNEKTENFVSRIRSNSGRLLQLINDFLDLSRVEAGRLELANQAFSPEKLAHRWKDEISVLAERKGLDFEVNLDTALPATLFGDEEAISKVALNLLGNAIKFTENGHIKLDVQRAENTWDIIIEDTGIGIPPHAREFIFEEFRQVDQSSKRKYGGTGLGLAIVQKYTRAMGGTVNMKSELGKGSTFVVSLPLRMSA